MTKALVVLSGGADSTICLYWAKKQFEEIYAVTFDYGQKHRREIKCAGQIAAAANVASWELIHIPDVLKGTSPLVDVSQKVEHYANADVLPGGLERTFVPGRNALFLVLAANRAYVKGCSSIVTGVCQEDSGGYPDCRDDFIGAMRYALALGLYGKASDLIIDTPLMFMTKAQSVLLAQEIGALQALRNTHTCYEGSYPPCLTCHSCLLRSRGFEKAKIHDPLITRVFKEILHDKIRLKDFPPAWTAHVDRYGISGGEPYGVTKQ